MNTYPWWVSSTGQGIAQRLLSFVALILPLLSSFGINIASGDIQTFINAAFIVGFGIWHLWAYARANYNAKFKLGAYAIPPKNV